MRKNKRRGFTVIELLVVLAIIGILGGLIMGAAHSARKQALVAKARASISSLETALGMFQSDIGSYPSAGNANMVTCLISSSGCSIGAGTPITTSQAANWSGPYMNFQTNEVTGGTFVDPWGNPYVYKSGSDHGIGANYSDSGYMDIHSFGPDGLDNNGSGDDVANWRR